MSYVPFRSLQFFYFSLYLSDLWIQMTVTEALAGTTMSGIEFGDE